MTERRQPARHPARPSRRVAVALRGLLRARDRGSFTAEMAAGLPALVLLLLFGMSAVTAVAVKGQCADAAREGALVAARGGSGGEAATRIAPIGADVGLADGPDTVTVTVRTSVAVLGGHVPGLVVQGSATAAREPAMVP